MAAVYFFRPWSTVTTFAEWSLEIPALKREWREIRIQTNNATQPTTKTQTRIQKKSTTNGSCVRSDLISVRIFWLWNVLNDLDWCNQGHYLRLELIWDNIPGIGQVIHVKFQCFWTNWWYLWRGIALTYTQMIWPLLSCVILMETIIIVYIDSLQGLESICPPK